MSVSEPFLSVREAVMEIRDEVKAITVKIDRIDREGSIGTKSELVDHETRLRNLERSGFRLAGAWTTVGVVFSILAGVGGLALGLLSAF